MKLVIDIDDNLYSYISKEDAVYFPDDGGELFEAVKYGTPLEEELEKIKEEIKDLDLGFFDEDYRAGVARGIMEFNKILNKHISELKGK